MKLKINLLVYFLIVGILVFSIIVTMNHILELESVPNELFSEKIIYFSSVKESDNNIKEIFDVMADIEKYPIIIPDTFVTTSFIEKLDNVSLVKNNVKEKNITMVMTTKHTLTEYQSHKIEVLDGLIRNSSLLIDFKEIDNKTQISISGEIHLHGVLTLMESAIEIEIQKKIDSIFLDFDKYVED